MKNKTKLWIGVGAYVLTSAGYGAIAATSTNSIDISNSHPDHASLLAQGGEGGEGGEGTTPPVLPEPTPLPESGGEGGEGMMTPPTSPVPDAGGEGGEGSTKPQGM